jgi:hypothetical protein
MTSRPKVIYVKDVDMLLINQKVSVTYVLLSFGHAIVVVIANQHIMNALNVHGLEAQNFGTVINAKNSINQMPYARDAKTQTQIYTVLTVENLIKIKLVVAIINHHALYAIKQ